MKFDFSLECVDVTIDGRALKFYPLNFKALRTLAGELETLKSSADPAARFVSVCKVLAASANRRNKTVTEEELEDMLSVDWANKIIAAVNELSGFQKVETPEGPKAMPVILNNGSAPIGGVSTAVSSVLQDGPGNKLTN